MSIHPHPRPVIQQPADPLIRLIPLTQGQVAIVDAGDYEDISRWTWYACKDNQTFYAERKTRGPNRSFIKMHRYIGEQMGVPRPDHKNRNGLDNRRSNLREATLSQQGANRSTKRPLKGIRKVGENLFQARIGLNKKQISLGTAPTEEGAARIYDEAAKLYYGEFANLNFPPNKEVSHELV